MNIQEIVKYNNEYHSWDKVQKRMADEKRDAFIQVNSGINLNNLSLLTLEELKELKKSISFAYTAMKPVCDEVDRLIEVKRLEKNPEFNKAKYYPFLNEIDFLTKEQIVALDKYLRIRGIRSYVDISRIPELKDYQYGEGWMKIFRFLHSKGVISASVKIICNECGDSPSSVNYEAYELMQSEKFKALDYGDQITQLEKYMDSTCEECDTEFDSLSSFKISEENGMSYFMDIQPDLTFEKL